MNEDHDNRDQQDEQTELVMKKEGTTVHIWVVVDGEEIYHAAPHVRMSQRPVFAAIQTFFSRAFEAQMDLDGEEEDDSRGFF